MKPFIRLTDHAKQRGKRRYGLSPERLICLAQKAVMYGYSINDAPSRQVRKYLKRKQKRGNGNVYVYKSDVFVISDDFALITTYRLPLYYLLTTQK